MPEIFVKMEKDGEIIEVHPLVVAAHEAVGWKQMVVDLTPASIVVETHTESGTVEEKAVKPRAKK